MRLHAIAALPMRIWLWLTTAIVTKEWVACHRKHHAFADREGDPHQPLVEGLREILLKGAFYYRKAVRQPGMLEKYGKGTPNDWLERHLLTPLNWTGHPRDARPSTSTCSASSSDPLVWGVQMIWIPLWAAGVINGIGHALGYRNFEVKDESRNISPIAIWLGGEELHNNHHADPKSAKFKAQAGSSSTSAGSTSARSSSSASPRSSTRATTAPRPCGTTRTRWTPPPDRRRPPTVGGCAGCQ